MKRVARARSFSVFFGSRSILPDRWVKRGPENMVLLTMRALGVNSSAILDFPGLLPSGKGRVLNPRRRGVISRRSCIPFSTGGVAMVARSSFAALCLVGLFLLMSGGGQQLSSSGNIAQPSHMSGASANIPAVYKNLPLAFEPNQGQADSQVKFLSRGLGYTLFLKDDEAVLEFKEAGKTRSIGQ